MAQFFAPVINDQQVDANGAPLSGGQIEVYLAGSSTPATTYSDQAGSAPNTNPIILNTLGLNTQGAVWITGGAAYKYIIKNALGVTLRTIDNITGINDTTVAIDQWVVYQGTPTFISATSFTVPGDQTPTFQVRRRTKTTNTGGVVYSTIRSSVYSAPNTTVTLSNTSGTLDAGLSQVSYGLISATDSSIRPTGVYSSHTSIASNTVLTAASVGGLVTIAAPSLSVTLPLGASVVTGDTFTFQATGKFTILRSGSDQLLGPEGLATSVPMFSNCSVAWNGSAWAVILGGDATSSAVVGAGNIGRFQLPGGLFIQWGSSVTTLDGSGISTITFPTAYDALYTVVVTNGDSAATTIVPVVNFQGSADFSVRFSGAGAITVRCNWIAFGLGA